MAEANGGRLVSAGSAFPATHLAANVTMNPVATANQASTTADPSAPSRLSWARRATVVSPRARVDVALPVAGTVAELLPELVRLCDAQRHAAPGHAGWVLTRLGGAPLPPDLTVAAAGVRDGDVLYLVPRERQGAPMLFDDVVDAIASASETSGGAWRPAVAHGVGAAGGAVSLVGAGLLLFALLSGQAAAPLATGGVLLVLLVAAGALSRVLHDHRAAIACAAAGVPTAVTTGLSALPPHHLWPVHGGAAALGLGVTGAYGVLAMTAMKRWSAWFGALAVGCALGAATAAVVGLAGVTAAHAGVVLAVLATAFAAAAPMVAMRLSRLPLPRVPSDITAFRENEEPTLGPDILGRTTAAQRMLTGLLAALGLCVTAGSIATLRTVGAWPVVLVGLLSAVWMLRSRSYTDTVQRVVQVGTGLLAAGWLAGSLVVRQDKALLLAAVIVLALAGLACFVYARHAGQGRRSPYWTRLLDVGEFLGVVALLPIAGVVLGVYEHLGHIKS